MLCNFRIHVSPDQSFDCKFRNVFKKCTITFRSAKQSRRWLGGPNISYWPQQLNFCVWCATSGCGVSLDDIDSLPVMIQGCLRFHANFTVRRVLYELGAPLPDDAVFSQSNNAYDRAAFGRLCNEGVRLSLIPAFLGVSYPLYPSWKQPSSLIPFRNQLSLIPSICRFVIPYTWHNLAVYPLSQLPLSGPQHSLRYFGLICGHDKRGNVKAMRMGEVTRERMSFIQIWVVKTKVQFTWPIKTSGSHAICVCHARSLETKTRYRVFDVFCLFPPDSELTKYNRKRSLGSEKIVKWLSTANVHLGFK